MMSPKIKSIFIITLLFLGVFFGVLSVSAHGDEVHEEEHIIKITDNGYTPKDIVIKKGDTVIFKNESSKDIWPASNIHPTHRLYPNTGIEKCWGEGEVGMFDACGPIAPNESFEFTFEHVGEWRYHDHIDPRLKGSIIVEGEPAESGAVDGGPTLWQRIKDFLGRIFGIDSWIYSNDKKETLSYVYNEGIKEGSGEIFSNKNALYSHIKKYGTVSTMSALHKLSSTHGSCHSAAHDAGRVAYEINDAKAFQLCSSECHSGCYHGATEAYFRDNGLNNIEESLATICSSGLNAFYSHQCIHGVGHGLMAWLDYELMDALESCDKLSMDMHSSCYSGVYMENVVGGLAGKEGHYTDYLSEDPHYPCNIVPEKYVGACYHYQTSRMVQLFNGDFKKVAEACSEIDDKYKHLCFGSMGRDVGGHNRNNPKGAIAMCEYAPEGQNRLSCLTGAVQDSLWDVSGKDTAIKFCKLLQDASEKNACYFTIVNRAAQIYENKEEYAGFCIELENPYTEECERIKI